MTAARSSPPKRLAGLPLETLELCLAGRDWTILAVRDQSALLAASEHFAEFPYGLLLWDSALAMAEVLSEQPGLVRGKRVLELGAGVGLAGLVARHLGARVTQCDHSPEALEICRLNALANGVADAELTHADWRNWHHDGLYDLIIGSDVLYDPEAHAPILAIMERNLAARGRMLLTDPGRMDTPRFTEAIELAGWITTTSSRVALPDRTRAGQTSSRPIDVIEARRAKPATC